VVEVSAIDRLRHSGWLTRIIPTLDTELARNLSGCSTVLDLGCGPNSPISRIRNLGRTVGVEPFKPYFDIATRNQTHSELVLSTIAELDFADDSFDAVILIDVIEHMDYSDGLLTLEMAERWARQKVIVNSPNGFVPQKSLDGNPLQEHKSGWSYEKMRHLGFRSVGLSGPKMLRHEVESITMGNDLLTSIRFRPRLLWFIIAAILQPLTYRIPSIAFSLMSVKLINNQTSCIFCFSSSNWNRFKYFS